MVLLAARWRGNADCLTSKATRKVGGASLGDNAENGMRDHQIDVDKSLWRILGQQPARCFRRRRGRVSRRSKRMRLKCAVVRSCEIATWERVAWGTATWPVAPCSSVRLLSLCLESFFGRALALVPAPDLEPDSGVHKSRFEHLRSPPCALYRNHVRIRRFSTPQVLSGPPSSRTRGRPLRVSFNRSVLRRGRCA